MRKSVKAAMERVKGDGSVQIGTYFREAKTLAGEIIRLQEEIHELTCVIWALKDDREEAIKILRRP